MDNFNRKSLIQLKKLNLEELKQYYVELREYEYNNNIPLNGIKLRKKIHTILLNLIKIDRILAKEKLEIISDKREKTDRPIIYACTHIGGNDIQRTFEAIKEHAYLFLGDPEEIYRDPAGLLLYLNGVICLETSIKDDRRIAKERSVELLKKGGNLLIYPEGAWNITENLPVMKLYTGTVKMALETGADIVPIAIEQYDEKFYVNIGKNIKINLNEQQDIKDLNQHLRDDLATLKWEIWERNGYEKRQNISNEFKDEFKNNIVNKCGFGYTIEDVYATMYKDPNEPTLDEVFAFRKNLSL